jgi:hypothetical protein
MAGLRGSKIQTTMKRRPERNLYKDITKEMKRSAKN